jgi:hypothetical protein
LNFVFVSCFEFLASDFRLSLVLYANLENLVLWVRIVYFSRISIRDVLPASRGSDWGGTSSI